MSDERKPLKKPHDTIGVQDLLSLDSTRHCGFLRKKGRLERFAERVKIVKPLLPSVAKWRQRFVVLTRGCIYIYLDEFSSCPAQAYSLEGFIRVTRNSPTDGRERWSFVIEPEDEITNKQLIFGCATEDDRKTWMSRVRNQLMFANDIQEQETLDSKEDYVYLEKYIKEPKKTEVKKIPQKSRQPPPPVPGESDEEEEDSDEDDDDDDNDDYDKIPEEELNEIKRHNLPAPKPAVKNTDQQVKVNKKPAKAPKPMLAKRITRNDFEFHGTNRSQIESVLESKPVGTFLVRKSRSDDREVLSVKTDEGVREYKIYVNQGQGVSIDNKAHFDSVEQLIENYMKHPLPNRTISLSRAFSVEN